MKILFSDKAPFLLTALLAVVTYQVNSFTNYLMDAPIITYKFLKVSSSDSANVKIDQLQLEFLNLNRKQGFKNLILDVKYSTFLEDSSLKIYEPGLTPIAPAELLPDSLFRNRHQKMNRYKIPFLIPRGRYIATLTVKHESGNDKLPNVYLHSEENVWLTGPCLEVFLIKYQLMINLLIISILIAFTGYYIFRIEKFMNSNA